MPLQGLFRSTGQAKLAEFLARDFSDNDAGAAGRQAAAKNAFVLISQHRAALAAAFFVLGAQQGPEPQAPSLQIGRCPLLARSLLTAIFPAHVP